MYSNLKFFTVLILAVLFTIGAKAQNDTTVYYLTDAGKIVSTKDSADVVIYVLPPDAGKNNKVYVVKGYYPDGKINLIGGSLTPKMPLKLQGTYTAFAPNGNIIIKRNFENGEAFGDVVQYYPNGRFYCKKSVIKTSYSYLEVRLKDCSDSTGKVLAVNGNGYWIKFDEGFKQIIEQGPITDGYENGIWSKLDFNNNLNKITYAKGKIVKVDQDVVSKDSSFSSVEQPPEFPGGMEAFERFIGSSLRYPPIARQHQTKGKVIVSFIVNKDGKLSDIKVVSGIGDGCDEEAVRVISSSPKWKPGIQNGYPFKVKFSIPITFNL